MAKPAERALSFGTVAAEYDRGRPGYPPEALRWLLGEAPLDVVDLGAGTGKLTAALVEAGHRVVAVEPSAEMRTVLAQRIPDARLVAAPAEATGLPAASADAVVAGSAFHWFDRSRALPEIARILRPAGTLGLLGNGFDTSTAWVAHLRALLGEIRLGRPGFWPGEAELRPWFDAVEDRRFPMGHPVDRDRLVDLAASRSRIATLPPGERRAVLDRVRALWDDEPELRGRDAATLPYVTLVRRARRQRSSASST